MPTYITLFLPGSLCGALLTKGLHRKGRKTRSSLCHCWNQAELRSSRMVPYIASGYANGSNLTSGVVEELSSICSVGIGAVTKSDLTAYGELHAWLQQHPGTQNVQPFTPDYYANQGAHVLHALEDSPAAVPRILDYGCGQGEMLTWLYREKGLPRDSLHCIELHPLRSSTAFHAHVLADPLSDLNALASGALTGSFDIISCFSVFHHIHDAEVRQGALHAIARMARPGGLLFFDDWDSEGSDLLVQWYDVAHVLLWVLMGAPPLKSEGELELGTDYESLQTWISLASKSGWHYLRREPQERPLAAPDAVGGFGALFVLG